MLKIKTLKIQVLRLLNFVLLLSLLILFVSQLLIGCFTVFGKLTLFGKVMLPIIILFIIYASIKFLLTEIVKTYRIINTYINFFEDYMEINIVKAVNSNNKKDLTYSSSYKKSMKQLSSGRGMYGCYVGILKKVNEKIYYSEIEKFGYIKDLKIKDSMSYPKADYPLNIGIIVSKKTYFIPYKQFTKKQMKIIYSELTKRNNKFKNKVEKKE